MTLTHDSEPAAAGAACGDAFAHVYDRLRRLAARYLGGERFDHTLQATALVHEAYLRLAASQDPTASPADCFARAAQAMRRVLVDHARRRCAAKRGAGRARLSLVEECHPFADGDGFVVAVDDALRHLAALDRQQAAIVELRFFAGLTIEETAEVLGLSARSVNREWLIAKGWLHRALRSPE